MRKTKQIRKCIFCGSTAPMTAQHVWPQALHKYLTIGRRKYQSAVGELHPEGMINHRISNRGGDIHHLQVKCVCEKNCNNGWMRRLEAKAEPILVPLIKGRRARITPADQRLLAVWCAMQAMVIEFDRSNWVTTHHTQRRRLMDKLELPRVGWKIWIGDFARVSSRMFQAAHPFYVIHGKSRMLLGDPPRSFNGQATTYVVGQMLVHIIRAPVAGIVESWRFEPRLAAHLRTIWPGSNADIDWPPISMNDREAELVADSFFAFTHHRTKEALAARGGRK